MDFATDDKTVNLQIAREYKSLLKISYQTLSEDDIDELQASWSSSLIPVGDNEREHQTFKELEDIREEIMNL